LKKIINSPIDTMPLILPSRIFQSACPPKRHGTKPVQLSFLLRLIMLMPHVTAPLLRRASQPRWPANTKRLAGRAQR
jgi:hypothetical protein